MICTADETQYGRNSCSVFRMSRVVFAGFSRQGNLIHIISIPLIIYIKLAILVTGDPKAPFSLATTLRCKGGRYSISRIASLYP